MLLEIAIIRLNGGTQPRAELNIETIGEYSERMKAGEKFPPITVFFDGKEYWLADGFHRVGAAMRLQYATIEAEVIQGTQSDAQWFSYSVNKAHGMRRTNEDKVRAVRAALSHPQSKTLSDSAIADHVGVRRETILKYRREIENDLLATNKSNKEASTSPAPSDTSGKRSLRTGRDGRTINTARIGKTTRRQKCQPRSAAEYYEAKQKGLKVRPPASLIKLELPNNNVQNCAYDLLRFFTFEYLQKVFAHIKHLHQTHLQKESSP
jgi:hypothetical protein